MKKLTAIAASPGIAIARVQLLKEENFCFSRKNIDALEVEGELEKFKEALSKTEEQLTKIKKNAQKNMGKEEAEIFTAHLMLAKDPEVISAVENKIKDELLNAEAALDDVVGQFVTIFESMDDKYMRQRASDIKDVGGRILRNLLCNDEICSNAVEYETILVAKDLAPSDTAQIDKTKILGFVTEMGGKTSHTAIMARSLEIPAVVGASNLIRQVDNCDQIIVDGLEGIVIINPSQKVLDEYKDKAENFQKRQEKLTEIKELPAQTKDGHRKVELAANIGTPEDLDAAIDKGAEGIGLYRSEFLYMDRDSLPTEEEQFEAYKEVAEKMEDKPVVIRTLDIGGDKELPYLNLPKELNPFLGYRAIRICLDKQHIFKTQLRAILRASVYGNIKIMYPMISSLEELKAANRVLEEVKESLKEEGIEFDGDLEVGMMIEIPAAAIIADILAQEVDFFSIGTNDLIQYTTAVDRMNKNISKLYTPFHPALIRLVKSVIDAAHDNGKWAAMCGEVAGDKRFTAVLLGLGLDEFSMSGVSIPEVKKQVRGLSLEKAKRVANHILELTTAEDIKDYLVKL